MTLTRQQFFAFIVIDVALIASAMWYFGYQQRAASPVGAEHFAKGSLRLTSTAFSQNEPIPAKYSCQSDRAMHPPLDIAGVPAGTKSLALVVEDPDAPLGTWVHWLVWNIPPGVAHIDEGEVPAGAVQGRNSAPTNGYLGMCPPSGAHRYHFKLFALDETVQLPDQIDAQSFTAAVASHVLSQTVLAGTYRKHE